MSTRFYLPSAGTAAVDPGTMAVWGSNVGSRLLLPLSRIKTGTAKLYQSVQWADVTPESALCAVYVSDPLAAQTITGNWTAVVSVYESNAAMNASLQIAIRIVSNDGATTRGTVYGGHSTANNATAGALGQEFPTGADATRIIPSTAGTSVTAQAGDRLVIELGYRADNTLNTAYAAELDLGDNQASDYSLTAGTAGRTADAWVETSQNITYAALTTVGLTLPTAGGGSAGWGGRAQGIKTVAAWETSFLTVYASDHTNIFNPLSNSGDSWDHYNLGYGFDGVLAMFLASGNVTYLDRCILYANNMKADAVASSTLGASAYGDSYLGWVSARVDVAGQEVPLFESFCWRHVVRMLRIIKEHPVLASTYATDYAALLSFVETNIWDKWWTRDSTNLGSTPPQGGAYAMYRQATNMAALWSNIAMNLKAITMNGARQTNCQAVKDNIDYVGFPAWAQGGAAGSNLRTNLGLMAMTGDPLAYNWAWVWGSSSSTDVQDISHGGCEMGHAMDAWERGGQNWTQADISKWMRGFTNHILASNNTHSSNVDGSGGTGGYIPDGYINFGRYDAPLQRRIQVMGAEADNLGGTTQWYGKGALNARYLLGR